MNSLPRESYLPELFSSLTSLCPHCQLSTKKFKKSFVHLQSLPSFYPPPIKHLSNAKPLPHPCFANWREETEEENPGTQGAGQKLGQTGAGDEVQGNKVQALMSVSL